MRSGSASERRRHRSHRKHRAPTERRTGGNHCRPSIFETLQPPSLAVAVSATTFLLLIFLVCYVGMEHPTAANPLGPGAFGLLPYLIWSNVVNAAAAITFGRFNDALGPALSRRPTAARCFSTRSAICRSPPRRKSCGPC